MRRVMAGYGFTENAAARAGSGIRAAVYPVAARGHGGLGAHIARLPCAAATARWRLALVCPQPRGFATAPPFGAAAPCRVTAARPCASVPWRHATNATTGLGGGAPTAFRRHRPSWRKRRELLAHKSGPPNWGTRNPGCATHPTVWPVNSSVPTDSSGCWRLPRRP